MPLWGCLHEQDTRMREGHHVGACVCPGLPKNGVRKGCGHAGRSHQNLREQMRRGKCSHREKKCKHLPRKGKEKDSLERKFY